MNIRWKFFKEETLKVQLPLEVSRMHVVKTSTAPGEPVNNDTIRGTNDGNTKQPTPPPVGFQGTSVLRDLEAIASPNPSIRKRGIDPTSPNSAKDSPASTVNRFIRRQHRKILAKIPVLTFTTNPNSPVGKYQVSLSPLAHSDVLTRLTSAVPMADEADLAWLRLPPPLQKPKPQLESVPSSEPKSKAEVTPGEMGPAVHQDLTVDETPEGKSSCVEDGPLDEAQHLQKEGAPVPDVEPKPKPERPKREDVPDGLEPSC